MVMMISVWRPQ